MLVECDNTSCRKLFELTPDSIIESRSVDENDDVIDWMPVDNIFACDECIAQYAEDIEDGE